MNLNKVDKIVLKNQEEVDTLLKWRDLNKDLVREFKPTLNEGLIVYQNYKQYFKQDDNIVIYRVWFGEVEVANAVIEIVDGKGGYKVIQRNFILVEGEKDKDNALLDMTTIHASLMAYMAHYEHHVKQRKEVTTKTKKAKHKGGGKRAKDRVVKMGRRIYDVTVPAAISTDKRPYERHAKTWGVTGHWREYKKSGKRVWIASYTKGDKNAEKEPRTFKL